MSVSVEEGVPVSIDGRPAAKIYVGAEEKVGLPNYSNAVVTASISRYVPDGSDEELAQSLRETAAIVEEFVAEERKAILKSLK